MQTLNYPQAKEFGKGVYRLTEGPRAHTHTYHTHCPWNAEQSKFIFFEYEKGREEGKVCLMDWPSGEIEVIGSSTYWSAHSVVNQFWLGTENKILYQSAIGDGEVEYKILSLAGDEKTFQAPVDISEGNEQILVGRDRLERLFSDDKVGDRSEAGVLRIDPDTGETSLLCSLQRIIENHPRREEVEGLHIFTKMHLLHKRLKKLAFNLTNSLWYQCGEDNIKVKDLHALDLETNRLTFVGKIGHHPIWHPTEPWLLSFSDDEEGRRRLTFDKLRDDGTVEREFLEYFSSSGHPSVDPTCRYIVIDNSSKHKGYITLDLFDLKERKTYQLGQCKRNTKGYPMSQAKRLNGETVLDFMTKATFGINKKYVVHPHPAWDRTGRYVAFNSDVTGESQVYIIDMAKQGFYRP